MKETILLHHCCAPCSPRVIARLRERFTVRSFWFNPNIQPEEEYGKRKDAFLAYAAQKGLSVVVREDCDGETWRDEAQKAPDRCAFCYRLRLEATARKAQEEDIPLISTTLLSSPYQKHDLIRDLGFRIAERGNLSFVYDDYRQWYYEGIDEVRAMGLYSQKYCGCLFSFEERFGAGRKGRRGTI